MLANIDYLMEPARPLMPHVIPIPGLFVKEPEQIQDPHLRTFMDTAEEGVVVNLFKALSNTDQRKMYRYFWNSPIQ